MNSSNRLHLLVIAFLSSASPASAQSVIAFYENFDQYASPVLVTNAGYTNSFEIRFSGDSGPQDFKAIFGFDYSTVTYPTNIPPAPHSRNGTTRGLYLTVNKDATGAPAAVNVYPYGSSVSFQSPDYSLKFDVWINWTNPATATEHALFGINHSASITNRVGQPTSDGLFFAMAGDGGASATASNVRDYAVFKGAGNGGAPILLLTNNTVFGPAPPLGRQFDNADAGFTSLFPSKAVPGYPATPAGSAGLRWVSGEVHQLGNLITWVLDGTVVAQYTNTSPYTDGYILLGYNDVFASIGDTNNFVIFDNIRVEPNAVVLSNTSYLVPEDGGIRMFFSVTITGTPPFVYKWQIYDENYDGGLNGYFETNITNSLFTNTISRFFGPFDYLPRTSYINIERYRNGQRVGFDGAYTPPACGPICLAIGVPATQTGTNGSGTNFSVSGSCGTFGPGSRWFRITTTNVPGIYTIGTEGSTYNTTFGVCRGLPTTRTNLALVACTTNAPGQKNRLQFETQPDTNYWLVVNPPPNAAALKLTYGYELKIANLLFNSTNRSVDLRTAPLPSLRYKLLASTDLGTPAANWSNLLLTNFSASASASNNVLRFLDTNVPNLSRRFYEIQVAP